MKSSRNHSEKRDFSHFRTIRKRLGNLSHIERLTKTQENLNIRHYLVDPMSKEPESCIDYIKEILYSL